MKSKPLNTQQLLYLRKALSDGIVRCDRSTGKALVARGFAFERLDGSFIISAVGSARARLKADVPYKGTFEGKGGPHDPSLLEDLT